MALYKFSSVDAIASIDPRIGPIHGVHPKAKATPIMKGKKNLKIFLKYNTFFHSLIF